MEKLGKLFTISDLHLSFGVDKPMDIFKGWENHTERLKANWNRVVSDEDTVVLIGDTSWSISLADAKKDFEFLHSLNGKKILLKGNHDYWWGTAAKITAFFNENNFDDLKILHNNYYTNGKIAVCGTRGWGYDSKESEQKIVKRESLRLEKSVSEAVFNGYEPYVFLHYPPAYGEYVCEEITAVLKKYNITKIFYGHIHGLGLNNSLNSYDGISMKLVSCDCIDFTPFYICDY